MRAPGVSRGTPRHHTERPARHGAVLVEFAIVVPLLFLFFFAAFEFCRVAMIRHTVDNAIYEGARRGIIPGGTHAEVREETQRILSTIGLTTYTLDVTPAVIDDDVDEVTIELTVPLDVNTFVPADYFLGKQVTRTLTMRREGR